MEESHGRTILLPEAMKAQQALRNAAGLGPEQFPLQAFVGMISDEVQALREQGWSDERIVDCIAKSSAIKVTIHELAENYATQEERQRG